MTTMTKPQQSPLDALIAREDRPGGIALFRVQAGVPAERRARTLVESVEPLGSDHVRHVVVSFAPGTELCCTSLWALTRLSQRLAEAGGRVALCGIGETTIGAARAAGLLSNFVMMGDHEEAIGMLLTTRGRKGKRAA